MAYPFLPVNPCCTDVVLNSPCGCSSTITNGGCNNPCGTNLTASSTIVYDGPALSCTTAEPCDTLNVILQKIDEIICNLLTQINILNIEIINIKNEITNINNNITNIYNILGECCTTTTSTSSSSTSTTTSTTTIHPCENFSLTNTGVDPVAIIITDCDTGEPEAIILNPGDTNICVVTDSPLTVPGTIVVVPNGPCTPPTSSTTSTTSTSTSSTSSTTTTTTTAIPCECLTFENRGDTNEFIQFIDCNGTTIFPEILANETLQFCGCCGFADSELVFITIGADCIGGLCPGISTTTTTSTTILPNCSFTGTANQLPDVTTTTTSSSSSTSTTSSTSTSTSSTTTSTTTAEPTTSTTSTSTSTSSSTTTTTTTLYPCDCLTFENTDKFTHVIAYTDCSNVPITGVNISGYEIIKVCGSQGSADDPTVTIAVGASCVGGLCPEPTTSTTSTTTTICVNCTLGDVTIGTQVWTGCNLNVDTYANGDPIPQVTDPTVWASLTTGAWCYNNNDPGNELAYGKLYNLAAVLDPRGLAPTGYHVPSATEWATLATFLGGLAAAGGEMKEVGTCHWDSPNNFATNSSGWTGLGGNHRAFDGTFYPTNDFGLWWTTTSVDLTNSIYRGLTSSNSILLLAYVNNKAGLSVRLIQD